MNSRVPMAMTTLLAVGCCYSCLRQSAVHDQSSISVLELTEILPSPGRTSAEHLMPIHCKRRADHANHLSQRPTSFQYSTVQARQQKSKRRSGRVGGERCPQAMSIHELETEPMFRYLESKRLQ